MTTNAKDRRLPAGLIGLLTYQWVAVILAVGIGFSLTRMQARMEGPDRLSNLLAIVVLFAWGATMGVVSLRMTKRSPRAFLVGMVCHFLLEIPALICMLAFLVTSSEGSFGGSGKGWEPVFLLIALMWSPFVLLSAWAFCYLCKFRKSLLLADPEAKRECHRKR